MTKKYKKRHRTLKNSPKMPKVSLKHLNYMPIGTHWLILHQGPIKISQITHGIAKQKKSVKKLWKWPMVIKTFKIWANWNPLFDVILWPILLACRTPKLWSETPLLRRYDRNKIDFLRIFIKDINFFTDQDVIKAIAQNCAKKKGPMNFLIKSPSKFTDWGSFSIYQHWSRC